MISSITAIVIYLIERPVTEKVGLLFKNYYLRGGLYILFVIPTLIQAPTMVGGICLLSAACVYIRAAYGGEYWEAPKKRRRK